MAKKPLKVLAMSDLHSGHAVGLTPPGWDIVDGELIDPEHYRMRRAIWDWFEATALPIKPDVLIINGDAIDGKGPASGGSEQLYGGWDEQVEIAIDIIERFKAGTILMSYGTAYHTGKDKDYELDIANAVGAEIGGEDDVDIRGTVFNYKHHLSRSGIPHGRATAVLRDALWNMLWAERGEYARANVLIRSHVHYHIYAGGPDFLAMTLPSLQGYGTKYGGRRMTGTVDIGFVTFDVYDNGFDWDSHIWRAPFKALEQVK